MRSLRSPGYKIVTVSSAAAPSFLPLHPAITETDAINKTNKISIFFAFMKDPPYEMVNLC
ncbi:hypothetical protein D3C84_1215170 [compost metagenome]